MLKQNEFSACTLDGVSSFRSWADGAIGFFRDDDLLRFADDSCNEYPLTVPGARFPVAYTPRGFVLRVDDRLLRVDPRTGQEEVIASDVSSVFNYAGINLAVSGDRLLVFSDEWDELQSLGLSIKSAGESSGRLFIEDELGVHEVQFRVGAGQPFGGTTLIDSDACSLRVSPGWLHYYSPCDDEIPVLWDIEAREAVVLDPELDVNLRYIRARYVGQGDAKQLWLLLLRDVDSETKLGVLVARGPDGREHTLGDRADLGWAQVADLESEDESLASFYALVDVEDDVGTLIRWSSDGTIHELASAVLRDSSPNEPVIQFDGRVGDYATLKGDELQVVAEGVPQDRFRETNGRDTAYSVFSEYDGTTGTLSIGHGTRPAFAERPRVIAREVPRFYYEFMDERIGLPGITYLSSFDSEREVGRLEYYNIELDFTGGIQRDVSDFISGFGGVFYILPRGSEAGIYWARAK